MVAVTENVYAFPFVNPVTAHDVAGGVAGHVALPGVAVTTYPRIALPPLFGAVHETTTRSSSGTPATAVGAPGTVRGVTGPDAAEAMLGPTAFSAVTVNVCAAPFVSPSTVHDSVGGVGVVAGVQQVCAPPAVVTVYFVIALPPVTVGGVQDNVA